MKRTIMTVISHGQSAKINVNVNKTVKKYCPKKIKGVDNPNKIFMNQDSDVEPIITLLNY